jgi:hypothetical protein
MLGSPNLYRGNAPLAMRLKIHDLHAQLAPLERYGVGPMSFAITGGVRALMRGVGSALRGAFALARKATPTLRPCERALTSPISD